MLFPYRAVKHLSRAAKSGSVSGWSAQYLAREAHHIYKHNKRTKHHARDPKQRAKDGSVRTNPDMFERLR